MSRRTNIFLLLGFKRWTLRENLFQHGWLFSFNGVVVSTAWNRGVLWARLKSRWLLNALVRSCKHSDIFINLFWSNLQNLSALIDIFTLSFRKRRFFQNFIWFKFLLLNLCCFSRSKKLTQRGRTRCLNVLRSYICTCIFVLLSILGRRELLTNWNAIIRFR